MEAAGLIEKVEDRRALRYVNFLEVMASGSFGARFHFEDVQKLPPPIIAFDNVAFSYTGKKEDYLYEKLSFGIEWVLTLRLSFFTNLFSAWTLVLLSLVPTERGSRPC